MSKSNASAKNRRAYGGNPPPPSVSSHLPVPLPVPLPVSSQQQQAQPQGFTLQQVIAVIDNRLLNLENFMKESKEGAAKHVHFENEAEEMQHIGRPMIDNSINEILSEFSARFDMIAEEVASLKDVVIKLQSYTMDVNRTLLEERINILSDLGNNQNQTFTISNETTNVEVDASEKINNNVALEMA
jgi:hypothetical protein